LSFTPQAPRGWGRRKEEQGEKREKRERSGSLQRRRGAASK
jgi:hypothetical protein